MRLQNLRGQTDGGSGVALRGLGQDLALGDFRELAHDLGAQMVVGENPDPLGRQHRPQAVDGLLDQGAVAEEAAGPVWRWLRRLRGQKRVPRPPARIRP